MVAHRRSMLAGEGWPWLIALAILGAWLAGYQQSLWAIPVGVLCILLFLLFRDPRRTVPPLPLGVLAPIDGQVTEVATGDGDIASGDWRKITIRTNHFGAYTVRAPIEGAVMDVRGRLRSDDQRKIGGLCIRSEEDDDVILLFPARVNILQPKAFVRYGDRVGQGQRFAYLRMAAKAVVYVPATAKIRVEPGDTVLAGSDLLAELVSRQSEPPIPG